MSLINKESLEGTEKEMLRECFNYTKKKINLP